MSTPGHPVRGRAVPRLRLTVALGLCVALTAWTAGWVVGALLDWWTAPPLGWVPLPLMGVVAAYASARAAAAPGIDAGARRFWRAMVVGMGLLSLAAVANVYDGLGRPDLPAQYVAPPTPRALRGR